MHFSIAPVELTTRMHRQFSYAGGTATVRSPRQPGVRHRVSVLLRAVANALEPAPAARQGA